MVKNMLYIAGIIVTSVVSYYIGRAHQNKIFWDEWSEAWGPEN